MKAIESYKLKAYGKYQILYITKHLIRPLNSLASIELSRLWQK